MRIVLDMQGAQTESRSRGIGRYSMALAQAIVRNASRHDVWLIVNNRFADAAENVRAAFKDLLPPGRIVVFHVPGPVSWETVSNNWRRRAAELIREHFIAELQPDVLHLSSLFEGANRCDAVTSIGVADRRIPTAVTLYDLIPFQDPMNHLAMDWMRQWYADKVESLKRADLLLAISDHSRREAMARLGIDGGRIVHISSAHADIFRPRALDEASQKALFSRYGIRRPYLMYTGALEWRKNLDGLLRAFALLPSALRERHQLVFAGRVSNEDRLRLKRLASKLGIDERFVLTGHVPDDDLVALFSHCALFVFPSLQEGFGLPALEAMACGAPTIGSNATSIPEVIGRADALFDPQDPQDIASRIALVLGDDRLRQSLREHALAQAARFSWDDCAKRAIAAFERLHESRPAPKNVKWHEIVVERAESYQRLIEAVADIPHQPVAPTERDLVLAADCIARNRSCTDRIVRSRPLPERIAWRIEGPFDSSYSLALLNRETARALAALGHRVILHSTEGPGDFLPGESFLSANPDLSGFYHSSLQVPAPRADVTSRNLYPPRVADMSCRVNLLHHYAWEESGFPPEWVEHFNAHLQGMTCLSSHVEKIMIDHGVTVPLSVSGCGVDHWERIAADDSYRIQAKSFRFVHVSSCFPRKGVDVLLKAYGRAFGARDDVTLIIKTAPNPHNRLHDWLAEARAERADFPDVQIIEADLGDAQLKALYAQCHVMVAPSRAEGFGLPMAEAMLSGLAVITTNWGGQLAFCNPETAWLVDYAFAPAKTHFNLFDSVWAEPDAEHLARLLRETHDLPAAARAERTLRGKRLLLERFRWSHAAQKLVQAARRWAPMPETAEPRIGWVTTWNTRCGIATYSRHLVKNMPQDATIFAARTRQPTRPDGHRVVRCWDTGGSDPLTELAEQVEKHRVDTLVVQFNYSFFDLEHLSCFLDRQLDAGRAVVLMMHATADPVHVMPHQRLEKIRPSLARCHRILVHAANDLNRLKTLGLVDNVTLFPHGVNDGPGAAKDGPEPSRAAATDGRFTLASYGFFLPHKGLLELIEAVASLQKAGLPIRLKMVNAEYPVPESGLLIRQARAKISALGLGDMVEMFTEYLPEAESLALLGEADLIVFPYQDTGESSSAAVRTGLATGRPVAVTPVPIFDDVAAAVYRLPGQAPDQLADGIRRIRQEIADGSEQVGRQAAQASRWCRAHRFTRLGPRLHGMLRALARRHHDGN